MKTDSLATSSSTCETAALAGLRTAITHLKPTGSDGFEGLLAAIFSKITRHDFRLAKAGLQQGKDGATLPLETYISFEAKRYDSTIPDDQVLTKIARLIGQENPPDLWILGATVEVGTQLSESLHAVAEKNGIDVLVLDWPASSSLPPLAVACALAANETIAFIRQHIDDAAYTDVAAAALAGLAAKEDFSEKAKDLERALSSPSLAGPVARTANQAWLTAAFGDRRRARSVFGQALAPQAPSNSPTQDRSGLIKLVQDEIAAAEAGEIVALIGAEGHGKSWLFAQTWLNISDRPLTVILPASTFRTTTQYGQIGRLIVDRLIEQTGDTLTDSIRRRWDRKISAWKPREHGQAARFIVCVDGLNEQPDVNWVRWLDGASAWMEQHGGVLVVTARQAYFTTRVQPALISTVKTVSVPEWSAAELKNMLTDRGIKPERVAQDVFNRLLNPRLLGIAFELLDNVQVETFTELTVERLLFEHVRIGARTGYSPEPVHGFVTRLAKHAQEIINRIKRQQIEDRLIFEQATGGRGGYELTPDLMAVSGEHFFRPLAEDPTLYTLSDEGLILALGLSIIKALQQAERNQMNIAETIGALIEPIAALDKTAEAVFSAAMVASVDGLCSPAIRQTLIVELLQLQNLNGSRYPAFVAVVRNVPDDAMRALFEIATTGHHATHQDWLVSALRENRSYPDCWETISAHVRRWLSSYSTDPALRVFRRSDEDKAAFAKALKQSTTELRERLRQQSPKEQAFFNSRMQSLDVGNPSDLQRLAFELLSGEQLAPFAESFIASGISMAFNSGLNAAYKEFEFLIRFNRRDWCAARTALLNAAAFLRANEVSSTGKWALVAVLRATCTPEDAEEESNLVALLTADQEKPQSWRQVESYCATDPCDPLSVTPQNIHEAIGKYAQINVDELAVGSWMTQADHLLEDTRPAVARFAPDSAISVHRKMVASILARLGTEKWRAITSLEPHTAVLDAYNLATLRELAANYAEPDAEGKRESRDAWLISQYGLLLTIPHLDGEAQVELFRSLPPHGPSLLKLADYFQPCSASSLESLLNDAMQVEERSRTLLALNFARCSRSIITPNAWSIIGKWLASEHSIVRAYAMAIVVEHKQSDLAHRIVGAGWSIANVDPGKQFHEAWYGSCALIYAAELGLLDENQLLDRILPQLFGAAATKLGSRVHGAIAVRIHRSVEVSINFVAPFQPPAVEQLISDESESPKSPPLLSLIEMQDEKGARAFSRRLSETDEEYAARQREGWKSFRQFKEELAKAKADFAIENVGFDGVAAYVLADPARALDIARRILAQPQGQLSPVVNFGLMLARELSEQNPNIACALFKRLIADEAFVRLTFGVSSLSLDAICIWESARHPALEALRAERLDAAANDHELAQEVLTALRAGREDFLKIYVEARIQSPEPASIARGLMVLGFGRESAAAEETIARWIAVKGFIGKSAKAAQYAYDRNRWAYYWFNKMAKADTAEEFWRYGMIYLKVVDGRIYLWSGESTVKGWAIQRLGSSLKARVKSRVGRWKSKRENTLLGDKSPSAIYTIVG